MKPKQIKLLNLPNCVTLSRLMLIPFMTMAFYFEGLVLWEGSIGRWIAALLFLVGGSTDWLDGYLARKYQQVTPFGAFLDPVADKLLVVVALILLVQAYATQWVALAAIVMISREIFISALREWMAQVGQRNLVAVSWLGKVKTVLQVAAITVMLGIQPAYPQWMQVSAQILLWIAVIFSLLSCYFYIKSARQAFTTASNPEI